MFINIAHATEAETKLTYAFPGMTSATVADPGAYIYEVFIFALGIVGLAALAFLVYGGIRYILSAGNPSALADAKDRMTAALIGVVLLLSSYLILNTIDPRLLQLTITDIKPAMSGNINFAAIDALVNEAIALINSGDIAGAKAKREEARRMGAGVEALIAWERKLVTESPAAAATMVTEGFDSGEQKFLFLRALSNAPGVGVNVGYDARQLIQRLPIETLYGLSWTLHPDARQRLFLQMTNDQRRTFYWNFADPEKGGNPFQQADYVGKLTDLHRSRLYLDLQSDGSGNGERLVREIVTRNNYIESGREIVGIWASLPPEGTARQTFLQQVKNTGQYYTTEEIRGALIRRYSGDEEKAAQDLSEFMAVYGN